jgi:xanthine dehydrogenase accessory factor
MRTDTDLELFDLLTAEAAAGRPLVLATVIARRGSTPRETGARMIFWANGMARGTIGGGCVEARIAAEARDVHLGTRQSRIVSVQLTDLPEGGTGDVCGGQMDVFLDYLQPEANDVVK